MEAEKSEYLQLACWVSRIAHGESSDPL
jgi:hypothetical protein